MAARLTLPEFIQRWESATLTERSAAQQHFTNLCDVLGQPPPASPTATSISLLRATKAHRAS
jgi:hypothetical protein